MAGASTTAALQQFSRLFNQGTFNALSDDRLLDLFLDHGDEDAFAALVTRHGRMVLGVCLDLLRDPADAEDAFQSTFLTLVRRARSIRGRDCVGGWLRRVAHRAALKANTDRLRRRKREQISIARPASTPDSSVCDVIHRSELNQAISAEIERLPEPYRRPVVLCLIEGLPLPKAATRLSISEGVVRGRLARARALLRDRLTRRGLAPERFSRADTPIVPPAWIGSLLEAVRILDARQSALLGWVGMSFKFFAALIVIVAVLAFSPGFLQSTLTPGAPPPVQSTSPPPRPAAAPSPAAAKPPPGSGRTIVLRGKVLDPDGLPVPGAHLSLVADASARSVKHGTSDANGSYRIVVPEETFRGNFTPSTTSPRIQIALIATAEGYGPGWKQLQASARDGLPAMHPEYAQDLHLAVDRPIEGRVVDADGKPISGAIVEALRIRTVAAGDWKPILDEFKRLDTENLWNGFSYVHPSGSWAMLPTPTTDSDGRFRLPGVGRDRLIDLRVTGPGVRPMELSIMTVDNVADIALALRAKYPRKRGPDGFFYTNYNTPREVPHAVLIYDSSPTIEVELGQTVSGVVRNARTGEPIPDLSLAIASRSGGNGHITSDQNGRYRGAREDHESTIWVYATSDQPDRYLSAVREFNDAKGPGNIVADFHLEPGVMVTGRVLEAGTDRPIVSSPRGDCHVQGHVVAGRVEYFPLSANTALRATPTGLYFAQPPYEGNRGVSNWIEGDGRFRLVVPPGPGILLIRASAGLPFMSEMLPVWAESDGFHRLFPYASLSARAKGDEAPGDDPQTFPGFNGPIPFTNYHAYQVINPPADAQTLSVQLSIPRAPSRLLRFVGPDGRPVRGLNISGLLLPYLPLISLDGSEVEAVSPDPSHPHPLLILSHDGSGFARHLLSVDGPQPMPPKTIVLEPPSSASGRLLDATTGLPLSRFSIDVAYEDATQRIPRMFDPSTTDAEGRFLVRGLIPDLPLSFSFQEPPYTEPFKGPSPVHLPDSLKHLALRRGEARDLGDLRILMRKP